MFVYSDGKITAIARPGDRMPGGGKLVNASIINGNVHINNRGDVAFRSVVTTDVDGDGFDDTGLFQWSRGHLSVIARTGTVIPGVGTVDELATPQLVIPPAPVSATTSGAINSDRGQVLFCATMREKDVNGNAMFTPMFAGIPGFSNCHGQSVASLAQQYRGLATAAKTLGYPSVNALQDAIRAFCRV